MKVFQFLVVVVFCIASSLLPGFVHAQPPGSSAFASVKSAVIEPASVKPGGKATLVITVIVNEGFHINANKPDDDMSVPTVLSINPPKTAGITIGAAAFPAAKTLPVSYSPKPIKGYEGTITISVPVTVKPTAKATVLKITGTLKAQGCNATTCFPPQSFPISATLTVTGGKK